MSTDNRILRSHLPSRLRLSDPERSTLAEIGKRGGRKDLQTVASVALPDTILACASTPPRKLRRRIGLKMRGIPE